MTFEQQLKQFTPLIHKTINVLQLQHERDEAFQIASITLWECMKKHDPKKAKLITYFSNTMFYKLKTYKYNLYKHDHNPLNEDSDLWVDDSPNTFEYLISSLDEDEKRVIRDYYYYGYTLVELSQRYNVSRKKITAQIGTILDKLRYNIDEE